MQEPNNAVVIPIPEFHFLLDEKLEEKCAKYNTEHGTKYVPNDFLPVRAEALYTGWDVRCADYPSIDLRPEHYFKIPLGFKIFLPKGWWMKLVPRSSTFTKGHIQALYGVIDESYEGEVFLSGQYAPDSRDDIVANRPYKICFGDRIAQLIPVRRQNMICTSVSPDYFKMKCDERGALRGAGGFGSTGK